MFTAGLPIRSVESSLTGLQIQKRLVVQLVTHVNPKDLSCLAVRLIIWRSQVQALAGPLIINLFN